MPCQLVRAMLPFGVGLGEKIRLQGSLRFPIDNSIILTKIPKEGSIGKSTLYGKSLVVPLLNHVLIIVIENIDSKSAIPLFQLFNKMHHDPSFGFYFIKLRVGVAPSFIY